MRDQVAQDIKAASWSLPLAKKYKQDKGKEKISSRDNRPKSRINETPFGGKRKPIIIKIKGENKIVSR